MSRRLVATLGVMAAALALGAGAVVVAGSGDDPALRALQADPLGRYAPPSGRRLSADAIKESDGGLLGKPAQASWNRRWTVSGDPDAALAAAASAARAAGWRVELPTPGFVSAVKRLATGEATASLTLIEDPAVLPDPSDAPVLGIALRHVRD